MHLHIGFRRPFTRTNAAQARNNVSPLFQAESHNSRSSVCRSNREQKLGMLSKLRRAGVRICPCHRGCQLLRKCLSLSHGRFPSFLPSFLTKTLIVSSYAIFLFLSRSHQTGVAIAGRQWKPKAGQFLIGFLPRSKKRYRRVPVSSRQRLSRRSGLPPPVRPWLRRAIMASIGPV